MDNINISENCFHLGYYAVSRGNSLLIGCPETSVRNDHYSLRSNSEEHSSHLLCCLKSRNNTKFQSRLQTT